MGKIFKGLESSAIAPKFICELNLCRPMLLPLVGLPVSSMIMACNTVRKMWREIRLVAPSSKPCP
ncbi:MAG: hypothetical protein HC799_03690 [Limnothrix sp. RL_2_0]|nr:hypothetical protein [Limnothrix sp. RL_2_0]